MATVVKESAGAVVPGFHHATVLKPSEIVLFSPAGPPAEYRATLKDDLHAQFLEAVSIDVPVGIFEWPVGADAPENVLGRSTRDPSRFRAFKYRREMQETEFEPFGMSYALFGTDRQWRTFMDGMRAAEAIGSQTDDSDKPEVWDEIERAIRGIT
jgi:hypothetical protein